MTGGAGMTGFLRGNDEKGGNDEGGGNDEKGGNDGIGGNDERGGIIKKGAGWDIMFCQMREKLFVRTFGCQMNAYDSA
ncbi:MAG: hypothetical protein ACR2P4_09060, partial [Gammaproteobacteria bacterium]